MMEFFPPITLLAWIYKTMRVTIMHNLIKIFLKYFLIFFIVFLVLASLVTLNDQDKIDLQFSLLFSILIAILGAGLATLFIGIFKKDYAENPKKYSLAEFLNQLKKPQTLLLIGIAILCFHAYTTYDRLQLEVIGKIVSLEKSHYPNHPNRPFTVYQVQDLSTGKMFNYKAKGIDPSLSLNLTVGSFVEKRKWSLNYYVNQKKVEDFPQAIYFAGIFMGVLLIIVAAYRKIKLKNKNC
jgi:hypothetical protein